jgi:hypothetical protein
MSVVHQTIGFPMGRKKPLPPEPQSARFEMRVEADWLDRVAVVAKRFGLSTAAYIRLATTERMERDESKDADAK